MKRKVIITVAPVGSVPTKKDNPHTPITPSEIARDVVACYHLGASVAHIHARDDSGKPTADVNRYREIKELIEKECDIIIQLSTGARTGNHFERGACIDLRPEMASLTTGSSNFSNGVNLNPPDLIEYLAQKMYENGVVPEIEVFDISMVDNARFLLKKGVLRPPLNFNLVFNVPGSMSGTPKNLLHMVEILPEKSTFSVTAIGRVQTDLITMAVILGGNIRVGLEDNLFYSYEDKMFGTNMMFVERAVRIIKELGREVARPDEAREILQLGRR
ncbi:MULTISPECIES: 3-keto-5-aminohexanoate cleavage protein [Desulfofundulus]|uniref:3-keto-5-aminohexanoate cleavage protein n=1 Tax=Desulfofundulus salinus TaxID=2419843 RepID=A0A494WY83_9FIRM|nr:MULTISPECIES: 3-keto-5-aminohexanoate cleavage protein [Desulfofundulus]NHM26391.1 3-keto-5-aminohexanoate cleavage protein [Desulfofundulus sp. TPOSR]RKO65494.1 3-keto-5-aminohexanoate cleavage protein [Desulfofundulus salinum]